MAIRESEIERAWRDRSKDQTLTVEQREEALREWTKLYSRRQKKNDAAEKKKNVECVRERRAAKAAKDFGI